MSARPHFLTSLKSEDIAHGSKWRLLEPLIWYSARLGRHIVMHRGFVADSYSVPALLAFLVFKIDRRPAFLHDHLYAGKEEGVTKEIADLELLDAMKACGIGWVRRRLIYDGPALFGGLFFKGRKASAADTDTPLDQPPGA